MEILTKIASIILAPFLAIGGFFSAEPVIQEYDATQLTDRIAELEVELEIQGLGAQNAVGGKKYNLSGSGVSASQNTITLTNFDIAGDTQNLTMTHFGDKGCGTLDPGHTTRQEFISFTGITQNADGSAQLTGVTRGLLPVSPYTASTTFQASHSGGSSFVISNSPPCFYEDYASLSDNEAITGAWTAPDPTAAQGLATKSYVDTNVSGGAVTLDGIAVGGIAGETFATGAIVYFDSTQTEWMKASASVAASSTGVQLGIAQGAGTNGNTISGGILTRGLDQTQTNGVVGTIYLSDTAGATSTSAGTISVILGEMRSSVVMYFNPDYGNYVGLSYDNTITGQNTFSATTIFTGDTVGIASTSLKVFTASGTWTKPTGLEYIILEIVGGGGSGGGITTDGSAVGGGGGGGGYCKSIISVAALASTVAITVGLGGNGLINVTGQTGSSTIFFDHATSTGGVGGTGGQQLAVASGGAGGTCTGGQIAITGGGGGAGLQDSAATTAGHMSGFGGSTMLGSGGIAVVADNTDSSVGVAGNNYGGGGSGAVHANESTARAGGDGADGVVIIYEIF